MGHFYDTIKAEGKNRADAQANAVDEFLQENGHRHEVRDVSQGRLIEKVPPMVMVEEQRGNTSYFTPRRDPTAPQSKWLEVWEFELHTHA